MPRRARRPWVRARLDARPPGDGHRRRGVRPRASYDRTGLAHANPGIREYPGAAPSLSPQLDLVLGAVAWRCFPARPQAGRSIRTTTSIWGVCGNMSTGWTAVTR